MDMSDDDRDMPKSNKRVKLDNETLQVSCVVFTMTFECY